MKNTIKYEPEKISLWDRLFNRYKLVAVEEGMEEWAKRSYLKYTGESKRVEYVRQYVKYHKIDRLTGAYEIIKKYFDEN